MECSICLLPIKRIEKITTSCGHTFHYNCFNKIKTEIIENSLTLSCPLCRKKLHFYSEVDSLREMFEDKIKTYGEHLINLSHTTFEIFWDIGNDDDDDERFLKQKIIHKIDDVLLSKAQDTIGKMKQLVDKVIFYKKLRFCNDDIDISDDEYVN